MKRPVRVLAAARGFALSWWMVLAAGVASGQAILASTPAESVRGTVVDPTGAAIVGAQVTVLGEDHSAALHIRTGAMVSFS